MKYTIDKIKSLIPKIDAYFLSVPEDQYLMPRAPGKWSRKEILGHLTDSAVNNLTRFTEISFTPQPYVYREYDQAGLVKTNDYQNMEIDELIQLWRSLNRQIIRVMAKVNEEQLNLKIVFTDGEMTDLKFIMTDYPIHMEYHINQILS